MTYVLEVAVTLTAIGHAPKKVDAHFSVPATGLLEFVRRHPNADIVGYRAKPVPLAA